MSAEFWFGFFYGAAAVALPVCGVIAWRANQRVQEWLSSSKEPK
jgi:hypothetical protein